VNWLDYVLLAIIVLTAVVGIIKGFVRQVIGLVAVIAGLVLAVVYYRQTAHVFQAFVKNQLVSNFLGFLLIFVIVLVAGSILGHLITKAMIGPLAFVNRLFGALFGLLKAVLICGVLIFALVSFDVARPAVESSVLAPACLGITRAVVDLVPRDLRERFNESYKRIRESGGKHGQTI
jgi:membrane protein required for colicin V production